MTETLRSIVLVGFMGTGKSSVSKLLSERLGLIRVDLDEEIEKRENCKISELFAEKGEAAFRDIESAVLASVLQGDSKIIATGGGAVLRGSNCDRMLEAGLVVALKADAEHIIARVGKDESRPLLQGDLEQRVHHLLNERRHVYDFAHVMIDTTHYNTSEVAEQIIGHLKTETERTE
ncbi:shikimate kinase [Paenibacillaceae bacterium]|nr:shikimate kinase [Paenibacillaceae bacterium]